MSSFGVTEQSEASGATELSNATKIPQKVSENWDYFKSEDTFVLWIPWRWCPGTETCRNFIYRVWFL